nr:uncharacterized protein LOC129265435 [Lytechinus pictus]
MSASSLLGLNEQKAEETDTSLCITLASESDSPSDASDMQSSKGSLADTLVIEASSCSSLSTPDNSVSSFASHDQPVCSQASTNFDVISILKQASGGTRLVEKIQAECMLSKKNKKQMVDILAQRLVSVHGHLPPSFVKKEMALGIIKAFPFLRDPDGISGYESFYCKGSAKSGPARGALEDRVSYLRRLAYQEERAQGRMSPPKKRKPKNERHEGNSMPEGRHLGSNLLKKCEGELQLQIQKKFDENFASKSMKMTQRWPALSKQVLAYYAKNKDDDHLDGLEKGQEEGFS